MVLKTYLDKVNTIVNDSNVNTGLNPVSELAYGAVNTRMLIHFDTNNLKKILNENGVSDYNGIKHILKITNCGIIDKKYLYDTDDSVWGNGKKIRAASFDLIFFLIPEDWDCGKGFDYYLSVHNQTITSINGVEQDSRKLVNHDGCNWYQYKNGYKWKENGIYSIDTLTKEYDKFATNDSDIIIARQHFDKGSENISIDLSHVVNKFLTGELENHGIGVAFTPLTELTELIDEYYVGFFTNHTNTFFEPFLETIYDDAICDNRNDFVLDKHNKLYLYCNLGGVLTNLDELPTCLVNGVLTPVKQVSRGVYCVDTILSSKEYKPNTMLFDVWGNLKHNGVDLDDVEMEFVTKPANMYFNIGNSVSEYNKHKPLLSGIQYDEKILRGDKRKVSIISQLEYSRNKSTIFNNIKYRLYVKDGEREITVIDYQPVHQTFNENYFIVDTNMLIPQRYYIDVKYNYGLEEIQHCNVLSFDIVSNLNKKYYM